MDLSKKHYRYKALNKTCDQAHVPNKYGKETYIVDLLHTKKKERVPDKSIPSCTSTNTQPWMKRCNKKVKLQ